MPLVVDPVMVASSGARLLRDDAVEALVARLFPLATVVTPNLPEARALTAGTVPEDCPGWRSALHELGAPAVIVTGGHAERPVDQLFDGHEHVEIPVERHDVAATHGAGCTHSATLAAGLARGLPLRGGGPRRRRGRVAGGRARPRRDRRRRRARRRAGDP